MSACGTPKGWLAHKSSNTRVCAWCEPYDPTKENPKKQAVIKPRPRPKAKTVKHRPLREPKPAHKQAECGTNAGYRRHHRRKEQSCQPCLTAAAKFAKDRRDKLPPKPVREPAKCGTPAGYGRHWRASEEACQPCKTANAERSRDNKAAKKAARNG